MTAYYNEFDPKAAAWLRELIKAELIAPGIVDERSIEDVTPNDLRGFAQCHFFAGIGGWSYALRLAGWSDDRPVWTGSPPCQPFSNAGKQKAQADARHLWPVFFNLIRECQPANIFGEQVEAAVRTGWLDDLQDDLEAEGYATGKIVLPACSVSAPHIRQRIWFVAERLADSTDNGHAAADGLRAKVESPEPTRAQNVGQSSGSCDNSGLAFFSDGEQNNTTDPRGLHTESCSEGRDGGLANAQSERDSQNRKVSSRERFADGRRVPASRPADAPNSIWSAPDWLFCRDGKWRPVESGTFPLANGVSERVGLLRGYGNAIVPQVAAEVIRAYLEAGGHVAEARAEIEILKNQLEDESMRADGMTTAHAEAGADSYRMRELIEQMRELLQLKNAILGHCRFVTYPPKKIIEKLEKIEAALAAERGGR